MDEKTLKLFGGIIGGFVLVIFASFIIASCTNRKYTYEKLIDKMIDVTKKYYEANEKELPSQDKDTKTITLKKMITDGSINELEKLFKDDTIKCDGNITVTNNNGNYLYTPYLDCGENYKTTYLNNKIIEDSLVETGFGLYEVKDQYIFKGEVENNYVKLNDRLYRIMRINEDGTIRVMSKTATDNIVWDNRYNPDTQYESGVNEFEINNISSRFKETLEEMYNDETKYPSEAKAYITTQELCIGKRKKDDATKDGSTECAKKIENQNLGAIAVYEFLQASLDENCLNTLDKNCRNYNWIAAETTSSWTVTGLVEFSQYSYVAYHTVLANMCSNNTLLKEVFNLTEKAIYISGDGTETDPYVFK